MANKYKPITVEELTKDKFKELLEEIDECIVYQSDRNRNTLNFHIEEHHYLSDKTVRIKLSDSLRARGFKVEPTNEYTGMVLVVTWGIPNLEEN